MGRFEVFKDKRGQFRFRLKADNGQNILASKGYATKSDCENAIESVKTNAPLDARYERLTARNGSPYFNLKSSKGQIIGTSEMYSSIGAMEIGITSVNDNALGAIIEDLT